jgi:hypothetical protein
MPLSYELGHIRPVFSDQSLIPAELRKMLGKPRDSVYFGINTVNNPSFICLLIDCYFLTDRIFSGCGSQVAKNMHHIPFGKKILMIPNGTWCFIMDRCESMRSDGFLVSTEGQGG